MAENCRRAGQDSTTMFNHDDDAPRWERGGRGTYKSSRNKYLGVCSLSLSFYLCPLRVLTAETITHHLSTDSDAQEVPLAAVPAVRWYPGVARGHLDAQGLPRTVAPITSAALPASGGDAAVPFRVNLQTLQADNSYKMATGDCDATRVESLKLQHCVSLSTESKMGSIKWRLGLCSDKNKFSGE